MWTTLALRNVPDELCPSFKSWTSSQTHRTDVHLELSSGSVNCFQRLKINVQRSIISVTVSKNIFFPLLSFLFLVVQLSVPVCCSSQKNHFNDARNISTFPPATQNKFPFSHAFSCLLARLHTPTLDHRNHIKQKRCVFFWERSLTWKMFHASLFTIDYSFRTWSSRRFASHLSPFILFRQ